MARRTKASIIAAARKGARTKKKKAILQREIQIAAMANAGLSTQEIALALGEDIEAVIKTLRLLTFAPHPLAKAVGIGATVVDTVGDLVKQVGRRSPDQLTRDIEQIPSGIRNATSLVDRAVQQTDMIVKSGSRAAEPAAEAVASLGKAIRETIDVLSRAIPIFPSPELKQQSRLARSQNRGT